MLHLLTGNTALIWIIYWYSANIGTQYLANVQSIKPILVLSLNMFGQCKATNCTGVSLKIKYF